MKTLSQTLLATLVFFVCGAAFALAQTDPAYTNGVAAQLSAAQIKKLQSLGAAVAVPTFVPDGFKLKKLSVPKPPAVGVIDYLLVYANAAGKTFTVQSTNDGIGDMPVNDEVSGSNQYFDGEFYAGRFEDDAAAVGAQWIGSLKKYQPRAQKTTQYYSLVSDAKTITPQIAARITKSLRYLKR